MRKIGFSHGDLFKLHNVNTKKNIQVLADCSSNTIEVNCHHSCEVIFLNSLLPYIKNFKYISLHAPVDIRYEDNKTTRELLEELESFYIQSHAELIVVHPDLVDDWSVFNDFNMKWAIENMDDRKKSFKNVIDLKRFFDKHPEWSLVLDVGHCNSNDKSMILAEDLIQEFRNKIIEIHLSGYEKFHDPLHRTKQTEIIKCCKDLSVPIIIESVFEISDGIDGVKKEFDYVVENLK